MAKRVPKHLVIRNQLLNEAKASGTDLLPSEREIASTFNVSRVTAKKALDSLAEENIARREVGKGTFLIRKPRKKRVNLTLFRGPLEHVRMASQVAELYVARNPDVTVCVAECYDKNWYVEAIKQPGAKVLFHS
ncbi:MAG: GntR family transcriptional regulator, partial [Planctomycetes bacterium]|nr:GntR family transcriptional regulator [Planctomycetota bacterium]